MAVFNQKPTLPFLANSLFDQNKNVYNKFKMKYRKLFKI